MSTQLPIYLIKEHMPRPDTEFYNWYNSRYSKGKEYIWPLLDYLILCGPTSNADLERALVKSSKKQFEWFDEEGNQIKPPVDPVYIRKETLKRHLDGLVDCHAIIKEGRYYQINYGTVKLINYPVNLNFYEPDILRYKKYIRFMLRNVDTLETGNTVLFYKDENREVIESNVRVKLALELIDEANKLLQFELEKNEKTDNICEYLLTTSQKQIKYEINEDEKTLENKQKLKIALAQIVESLSKNVG